MRTPPMAQQRPGMAKGGAVGMAAAVINLLISFGVPITLEQSQGIYMVVASVAPVVAGWLFDRPHRAAKPEPPASSDSGSAAL